VDKIDLLLIHRPDPLMDHAKPAARSMTRWRVRQGARRRRVELQAVGLDLLQSGMEHQARDQPDRDQPEL
jgi:predicted oxidoreductase